MLKFILENIIIGKYLLSTLSFLVERRRLNFSCEVLKNKISNIFQSLCHELLDKMTYLCGLSDLTLW